MTIDSVLHSPYPARCYYCIRSIGKCLRPQDDIVSNSREIMKTVTEFLYPAIAVFEPIRDYVLF